MRGLWLLPLLGLIVALALATQYPATTSSVQYLELRPIDRRTYGLVLSSACVGPIVGWTAGAPGLLSRRRWTLYACSAVALIITSSAMTTAGFSLRVAIVMGVMSALQAATVWLGMHYFVRRTRGAIMALLACLLIGAVSLLGTVYEAYGFIAAFVPTLWMGEILALEQWGKNSLPASSVGLALHLLPLIGMLGVLGLKDQGHAA